VIPLRGRCGSCRVTQVLLDQRFLSRRMDGSGVIGSALIDRAQGGSLRRVADRVSRPLSTVRGWVSAALAASPVAPVVFSMVIERLGVDPGGSWATPAVGVAGFVQACGRLAVGLGRMVGDWLWSAAAVCYCRVLQPSLWQAGFPHQFALVDPRVVAAVLSSGP